MNPYDPRQPYPQQSPYPPQQGHYPQPQGYAQAAVPQKKGMGAGAIVAIVLGLLFVLGGGAALVVFLVLGSSSTSSSSASAALSDGADNSAVLKAKAEALQRAIRTRDSKQVEGPLLEFAMLPDKALPWFAETFGATVGADVYGEWDRDVFKEMPKMIGPFKDAETKGYTELRVTRLGSAAEIAACTTPFCSSRKDKHTKMLKAMKKPVALYVLRFAKPGSTGGIDEDELAYFAVANGQLVHIGALVTLW